MCGASPEGPNASQQKVGGEEVSVARSAGPHHQVHPTRYVRGLILGKLSRVHQLADAADDKVLGDMGRVLKEFLTLGYTCKQLGSALYGLR